MRPFLHVTLHFSSHHTCHISTHFLLLDFYHPSNVWSYLPSKNPLIMQLSFFLSLPHFSAVFLKTLTLCSSLNFKGSVYTDKKTRYTTVSVTVSVRIFVRPRTLILRYLTIRKFGCRLLSTNPPTSVTVPNL